MLWSCYGERERSIDNREEQMVETNAISCRIFVSPMQSMGTTETAAGLHASRTNQYQQRIVL